MRWQTIPISEIAQQVRGVSYNKSQVSNNHSEGFIPILRAGNIQNGSLILDQDIVFVPEKCVSSQQLLRPGDIVLAASSGSLDVVGKAAQIKNQWFGSFGAFCKVVRATSDRIDPRYLHHFFQSSGYRRRVSSLAAGANINNLKNEHIDTLEIPIPPLEEQRRIAAILDKAIQIHRKISNSSKLEDEFNASAFNAIFGDPTTNPKGFPETRLADLCERPDHIKCGPFGTQLKQHEFRGSGVPLWGIKHVNRQFQLSTNEFLEEETAHRLSNYSIQPGDIVMTRKGTIGNCSVYPENFSSGIMHSDLLRIRLDKTKCLPDFAAYQLHHSPAIKRQIQIISGGAVMAGINVGKLKGIKIVVPHIDIQRKFTSLLDTASQKTWAQKQIAIKYSLELIASLESQVFSGMQ